MAPDFVGRERAIFSGNNCCKVRIKREETVERPDFARVKLECHHIRAGVAVSFHYGAFRQVFTVAYLSAAVDKSDRPIQDELLTVRGHTAPGEAPAVGWGCTVEHTLFQLTRPDAGPFEGRTGGPNPAPSSRTSPTSLADTGGQHRRRPMADFLESHRRQRAALLVDAVRSQTA